jgi:hypothetical protein
MIICFQFKLGEQDQNTVLLSRADKQAISTLQIYNAELRIKMLQSQSQGQSDKKINVKLLFFNRES